jgi:hypothetical protein
VTQAVTVAAGVVRVGERRMMKVARGPGHSGPSRCGVKPNDAGARADAEALRTGSSGVGGRWVRPTCCMM